MISVGRADVRQTQKNVYLIGIPPVSKFIVASSWVYSNKSGGIIRCFKHLRAAKDTVQMSIW